MFIGISNPHELKSIKCLSLLLLILQHFLNAFECFTMKWGDSMLLNGSAMGLCRIAFVHIPLVYGVL